MSLRKCTESEFDAFVAGYPRPLERDVAGIFEPPLVTLNDFTLAPKWPDSVVASYYLDYLDAHGKVVPEFRNGFRIEQALP